MYAFLKWEYFRIRFSYKSASRKTVNSMEQKTRVFCQIDVQELYLKVITIIPDPTFLFIPDQEWPQSNELTKGPPWVSSALSCIGGVHIAARALHVLNLIWFGYIKQEVGFIFVWSGSGLRSLFKYSKVKLKNQKHIAVDVLFKAYPMVPLSCRSNLALRYFESMPKKTWMIRLHKSDWYQVGRVLVPRFLAACPHPVTLAGMLIMSNSYLPTSSAWEKWDAITSFDIFFLELI